MVGAVEAYGAVPEVGRDLVCWTGIDAVGADMVEVSPPFDPSGLTAYAGAVMMFEILCPMAEDVARSR